MLQGRQIVEVQLDPGEIYHAWYVFPNLPWKCADHLGLRRYPTVTRVRRTVSYLPAPQRKRTIERTIYW